MEEIIVPDKKGGTQKVIDPLKPLTWKWKKQFDDNSSVYDFYKNLKDCGASAICPDLNIEFMDRWIRLNTQSEMEMDGSQLELFTNQLLEVLPNAKTILKILGIYFPTGAAFSEWISRTHINYNQNDIQQ